MSATYPSVSDVSRAARRRRRTFACTLVASLFIVMFAGKAFVQPEAVAAARLGAIRGRVELKKVAPVTERRPTVADLGAPRERDLSDRLRSVVYLESAPRGAFEQTEPGRAVMNQRNETFVP